MKKRKKKEASPQLTEEHLLKVLLGARRPVGFDELENVFAPGRSIRKDLKRLLGSLVEKGRVTQLRNKRFGITKEMNLITGTLWCTRSGNGFVIPDSEGGKDIFVSSRNMGSAVHGDRVTVRLDRYFRGKPEGKIIRINERKSNIIIGFTKFYNNNLYILPEDARYNIEYCVKGTVNTDISSGRLVVAEVTAFPGEKVEPQCRISKVLGDLTSVSSIGKFIEYKHSLPRRFTRAAEEDSRAAAARTGLTGRTDLRDLKFVTIDGEHAKDFDDAVCVERTKDGFILYVAIADVSHYVHKGSSLDREAFKRGTSVYFPDRAIPMLPKVLSTGICSLNPLEDRLTVTAKLRFNSRGMITGSSFHPCVIRSAMRLTYSAVEKAVIENDKRARKKLDAVLGGLTDMAELAGLISKAREERGSIDFDLPEPEVILDIKGGVKSILRARRLFSHRIIEEFMIAANESVANLFVSKNIPALFRIHEPPEKEKLKDFERLLQGLGVGYKKTGSPRALQEVLGNVSGTNYEFIVNRVLLRSMKQARYFARNRGHYGLSSESYLHFTSPIRRYPDLVCHRVLKGILSGNGPAYSEEELAAMANHLSERERLIMEAERELEDRIRILYMKDKVGEIFDGVISHVTSFGFFVELTDVFVEGLVLLSSLEDDYYHYQEERFRIIGRRTKKSYRIGDAAKIKVVLSDVESKRLHFELA
ncbi:MAG TPA: ribonuclease R [Syntrophorhabdaceae bacterium]|nr:ribonuclease R [Syntrophorhabdaceae bacterium]